MKRLVFRIAVAGLSLALLLQFIVYRSESPAVIAHASWLVHPHSLEEAKREAKLIVLAEVAAVERGDDLAVEAKGEPTGEDRIPTQRIALRVLKAYAGDVEQGAELKLFQTGSGDDDPAPPSKEISREEASKLRTDVKRMVLEDDPPYAVGERYLLLLTDGPDGMLRTISPEGRYQIERDGHVHPASHADFAHKLHGVSFAEFERMIVGN